LKRAVEEELSQLQGNCVCLPRVLQGAKVSFAEAVMTASLNNFKRYFA
jgi:hypothetical protein